MDREVFERAKALREEIKNYEAKKNAIEKLPERPDDLDYIRLREGAHWAVCEMIQNLERQFKNL